MTKNDISIDKKSTNIKKKQPTKPMKLIKRRNYVNLNEVYNKQKTNQYDAIKKRKTVKKNKHIFLNKKYTKKRDKKQNLQSGSGLKRRVKKAIKDYTSTGTIIRNNIYNSIESF